MIDKSKKLFKRISPKFQIGIDPSTDFSVSYQWDELKKSPGEILNLPEEISKEKK